MPDRISVDFGSLDNNNLLNRGRAVVLALKGSDKYRNPPVTMALLESVLDKFHNAVLDFDGTSARQQDSDGVA